MQLLLLVDIAPFAAHRETVLSRCLLAVGRLLQVAASSDAGARWGYRLIDSRCKPEAFLTRYKGVAGHGDRDFPGVEKGELSVTHSPMTFTWALRLHPVRHVCALLQGERTWWRPHLRASCSLAGSCSASPSRSC